MADARDESVRRREVVTGTILFVLGIAWTTTVYYTVPEGRGAMIGPRAFPLYLGTALILLSGILLVQALAGIIPDASTSDAEIDVGAPPPLGFWQRMPIVVGVCAIIGAYGWMMQALGFLISTILVVATTLLLVVQVRRPMLILGMSLGIAVGAWLLFGQLLGSYMPRGTLIPHF